MTHEEIFVFDKHKPKLPLEKPFVIAAVGLAHGHIGGMAKNLMNAGATLKYIYDDDSALVEKYKKTFPNAIVAQSYDEILADTCVDLIASAAIPRERAGIAIRAMESGKDAFLDKAPVISLSQLEAVKAAAEKYDRKLFVCYSEYVSVEAAVYAKQLIDRGVIGEVFHIDIVAPHNLSPETRPAWFFEREKVGGIITDIGSHQLQQFLEFSGAEDAVINSARVANYFNREWAENGDFDDFGDLTVTASNGVTGYIRIDWQSPKGIGTWGDVRAIILGSRGYIELRKNCNIGCEKVTNTVYVCTADGVYTESVSGKVGLPFFTRLIADCQNRTETAMSMHQTYKAIELAIKAQMMASEASR